MTTTSKDTPEQELYKPEIKRPRDVAANTLEMIRAEATGHQLGLRSRFGRLNVALGKYFRFRSVYFLAGLSGHGKSTLLNHTIQDFVNTRLNYGHCVYDYIVCHHCFEMPPENEEIRKVSAKMRVSYNHLLSSEFNYEHGNFNTLDEDTIKKVEHILEQDYDKPLYYFDQPGTLDHIVINIQAAVDDYKQRLFADPERLEYIYTRYETTFGKLLPRPLEWQKVLAPKVVNTIDHTLLIEKAKTEKDILEMMRNLGRVCITLKKRGYMSFLIGQFNNNIERIDRIKNPELHYPMKSDFYAQGEIFNACDLVMSIHQPDLMGIGAYGKAGMPTRLLVHLQIIKNRFGNVGSIWLKNDLQHGRFINFPENELELLLKGEKPQE